MKQLLYILLMLCTVPVCGQVGIYADTNKRELRTNEQFTLTIVLDIRGEEFVQESSLKLPDLSKFNVIGTGSDQDVIVDKSTGTHVKKFVYLVVLDAKQTGWIKIGSALVQVNGKIYKTEPFDILVKEGEPKEPSNGIDLSMEVREQDIYLNQPTVAVLKAYSTNYSNLRNLGKIIFPTQDDMAILPINIKNSEVEQDDKTRMSSQVLAMVLLIPKKTGNLMVRPFSISYNEGKHFDILSNKVGLTVKDFPKEAPKGFRNVVGEYKMELSPKLLEEKYEINQPIEIQLKLTGEGSLDTEYAPRLLKSKDYEVYEPVIKSNIHNTSDGRKVSILMNYIIIPKKTGDIRVGTEPFSFFNPDKNKYMDLGMKTLNINVVPALSASGEGMPEAAKREHHTGIPPVKNPMTTITLDKRKSDKGFVFNLLKNKYLLGLLSVFLLWVIVWIYRKKSLMKAGGEIDSSTIKELEEELKTDQLSDTEVDFVYLDKLLKDKNFDIFFKNYENMFLEIEHYIHRKHQMDVVTYLTQSKGRQYADIYDELKYKIQIEKYSPVHSQEYLEGVLQKTREIFYVIKVKRR